VAVETGAPATRRSILAAGLGGLVALVAAALGRPSAVRALDGQPALLGTANTSTIETSFQNTDSGEISLRAMQGAGTAIRGESSGGVALHGEDAAAGSGLTASSESGTGAVVTSGSGKGFEAASNSSTAISGSSNNDTATAFPDGSYRSGVVGTVGDLGTPGDPGGIAPNSDEVGVYGFSDVSENSAGVWGDTWDGAGVLGTGSYGVIGIGESFGLYGTTATANTGYALYTQGPIQFNGRSGRSYVQTGKTYREVPIAGMHTTSVVIATLQTNRAGFYVQSVIPYTGRFRLYLNRVAPGNTYFSYLVIG
jgi:hypothetical protein